MLMPKQKKNQCGNSNRLLISINVLGSAGPIRFVVKEEELVAAVIDTALKSYTREGRLPVLGSKLDEFLLYSPNAGPDALSPWATIGSLRARNFVLYKKPQVVNLVEDRSESSALDRKGSGRLKSWIHKSFNPSELEDELPNPQSFAFSLSLLSSPSPLHSQILSPPQT